LEGLNGGSVSLEDLKGKVVVLHFWATWCPPCLEELPRLLSFSRKQDPSKYVLLPVSVDKAGRGSIKKFLESWGLEPDGYLDPGGKLARKYGTIRFPETYILDPQGILRKKVIGAGDWDVSFWERFLQQIASERKISG
jgi:thiol-disulfide isomerase/thioredoxin